MDVDVSSYDGMILSYGAGVNSTALAILLINNGWRGEIVFADTGCEWLETYCFMDYFEAEWLKPKHSHVVRLKGRPWQRYLEGAELIDYCESAKVIPLAAVRWCTMRWKVQPLERYAEGQRFMLGIAAEEAHRQIEAIRPLVDWGVDRDGCVEIIKAEGLPVPRKSGCYICPFQRDSQWRELWERYPDLFDRAMCLEESVQRTKPSRFKATIDPAGKITLRMRKAAYEAQMTLPDIDMDSLRRYQPCICGL